MLNVESNEHDDLIEIIVSGEIISLNDSLDIKQFILNIISKNPTKKIKIIIRDSKNIPSTLLGYFLKIGYEKKSNFEIEINNKTLFDLLKKMMLLEILNAKFVEPK